METLHDELKLQGRENLVSRYSNLHYLPELQKDPGLSIVLLKRRDENNPYSRVKIELGMA